MTNSEFVSDFPEPLISPRSRFCQFPVKRAKYDKSRQMVQLQQILLALMSHLPPSNFLDRYIDRARPLGRAFFMSCPKGSEPLEIMGLARACGAMSTRESFGLTKG